MIYYDLWLMMWKWKREFSVREFKSAFQAPSPNKVLFDMAGKGFLERAGRGNYRVISPEKLFENRADVSKAYDLVGRIGLKYCLTGPDAVFLWTKGGYQVGRFFGFYPIHLKILRSDLKEFTKMLKSEGMKFHVIGTPLNETYIGAFYVLIPEEDFRTEKVDGFFVDSLKETVGFCKRNIYQYEPALEMLNEMYELGMKVRYREV